MLEQVIELERTKQAKLQFATVEYTAKLRKQFWGFADEIVRLL